MRALGVVFVTVLVIAAGVLGFVNSGLYNVAASEPHTPAVAWLLQRTTERSVAARAEEIRPPAALDSAALVQEGAEHYAAHCQICHGAPGLEGGEIGGNLNPPAPDLAKVAPGWTPGELFWIAKHGIRMTGMPAWGDTHTDEELWAVTAFVRALPRMEPSDYAELVGAGAADPGETQHPGVGEGHHRDGGHGEHEPGRHG